MDDKTVRDVFEELLPSLEALDTKCGAILQFLKNKGMANDDELAPYFEQAGNASSVRWRAARVRINHLLSGAEKDEGTSSSQESEKKTQPTDAEASATQKSSAPESGETEKSETEVEETSDNAAEVDSNMEQTKEEKTANQSPDQENKDAV
jgi:hypothetical protein